MAPGRRSKTARTAASILSTVGVLGAEGLDHDRNRAGPPRWRRPPGPRTGRRHRPPPGSWPPSGWRRRPSGRPWTDPCRRRRTAAVAGRPTVGVDDDLATGQACVSHRATDDEAAGRVDQDLVVVVGELLGDDRADHVLDQVGPDHRVPVDAVVVLGRDDHGLQAGRLAVLVVEGDLGLAVGAEVRNGAGLADLGVPLGHPVGVGGSGGASGRRSRCRRSRTSCPGRRRPARRR